MGMIGNAVDGRMAAHTERMVSVLVSLLDATTSGNNELVKAVRDGHVIRVNERELARAVRSYA